LGIGYTQWMGTIASLPKVAKNGVWPVLLCTVVL